MRKILHMMILGLFLGFQTMSVSDAREDQALVLARAESNWKKQMSFGEKALSVDHIRKVKECFDGYKKDALYTKKFSEYVTEVLKNRGLNRTERSRIKKILFDSQLFIDNKYTGANGYQLKKNFDIDSVYVKLGILSDENVKEDNKKTSKKAKKTAKKNKKKLKKQNKNKGKKSKKFQEEEVEEVLDEENEELNGVPAPDDEDDYEEEE